MDGAEVRVLEKGGQVGLRSLLQRHEGVRLETKVSLEVLNNLAHKALERELPDEKLRGLLVATDLPEGNGAGPVAVGLLVILVRRGRLASCLACQLLPGSLASSGLACGLLGAGHVDEVSCECRISWAGEDGHIYMMDCVTKYQNFLQDCKILCKTKLQRVFMQTSS